ncbi:hypothetical protein [Sphingobacterium sp. LRF_L2]|uniref:hypothetical protein n=1 Tax=Sphingobacterium sp. LRF_L2 TaxID=3369421 RepID=UPI003F60DB55
MITSFYARFFIYLTILLACRFLYVFLAFLLGFGSSPDHFYENLVLIIIIVLLNIAANYWIPKEYGRKESLLVLSLTILAWIIMHFYYS